MAQFDREQMAIIRRLQSARISLMSKQPFYALLLMNLKFAIDLSCETAYTDGSRIAFNPDFIRQLSNEELEFVLMHEVLHVVLAHPFRHQPDYEAQAFDEACDIIVNSNILYSFGMDKSKITLRKYGESMHLMPNGDEGYKYSMEEAYKILLAAQKKKIPQKGGNNGKDHHRGDTKGEENGNGHGAGKTDDKQEYTGQGDGSGQGKGKKGKGCEGKSGTPNSLEDLITSIKARNDEIRQSLENGGGNTADKEPEGGESFDDHSFWEGDDEDGSQRDVWMQKMINATEIIASIKQSNTSRGVIPALVERMVKEYQNPVLDWRTILCDFVQEDICDYSFAPPDKRMEDSPFFLPDFNEKDESVKNLLFMIDTSASMSDDDITECYSEIYGAIQQFDGKLTGKLGFFDASVVEPVPFKDEEEFKIIRPKGGGGTSFEVIFNYVRKHMQEELPVSIIILTDGYAPFPDQTAAMDIPVLWIINNTKVEPPWGKIARMVPQNTTT